MLEMLVSLPVILVLVGVLVALILVLPSIHAIGPTEVGLVTKRFGLKKLCNDNPIAFNGEAGYQAELLMPGWRFKFWIVYAVDKFPWVQVPAGEIGVVISQIGKPLPIGAKSAKYKTAFGNFSDLKAFVDGDGEKGVQRPVLSPGTMLPIHPIAFLVITKKHVYGLPIDEDLARNATKNGHLSAETFGLKPDQLNVFRVEPRKSTEDGHIVDVLGIVTALEGEPLPAGHIAGRLGDYSDIEKLENDSKEDASLIEVLLGNQNAKHNNYQDFQSFLDKGGKIGLQHDPLLYGAYTLNPFLISVEVRPMLVVEQGQVAVIKSYVGLVEKDTSGTEFKFGTLVRPGHRGIWQTPLRTGKYAINPRCYEAQIIPTCILTLNWAAANSLAHNLDVGLHQITAKSREGFIFNIDLQVQIHVPDAKAPRVISAVGTMANLVNEVLQAAVGNHFRDKLQSMEAVRFIQERRAIQDEAQKYIREHLEKYEVETLGVYIQDVVLPAELVHVLTTREIANQQIQTFQMQKKSEDERVLMENTKGTADMQAKLAQATVNVEVEKHNAEAMKAKADGEATYTEKTGRAKGAEVEAVGLARARAYREQVAVLGPSGTTLVNVAQVLADKGIALVPHVLVGGGSGNAIDALAAVLTNRLDAGELLSTKPAVEAKPAVEVKPAAPPKA